MKEAQRWRDQKYVAEILGETVVKPVKTSGGHNASQEHAILQLGLTVQ